MLQDDWWISSKIDGMLGHMRGSAALGAIGNMQQEIGNIGDRISVIGKGQLAIRQVSPSEAK